jgi:CBS domain-containing protein
VKAAIVEQARRTPVYGDFKEPVPSTEENPVTAAALSPVVKARAPGTHYSSSGGFPVKFEARIKEFIENFPDLVALVEPLLVVRQVLREQTSILHRRVVAAVRGKLAGIISIGDVVKHRLDDLELEASVLRDVYIASH